MGIWSAGQGGLMVLRGGHADQPANQMETGSPSSSIWSCLGFGGVVPSEKDSFGELQQLTLETAKAPEFVVGIRPRDSLCSQCSDGKAPTTVVSYCLTAVGWVFGNPDLSACLLGPKAQFHFSMCTCLLTASAHIFLPVRPLNCIWLFNG